MRSNPAVILFGSDPDGAFVDLASKIRASGCAISEAANLDEVRSALRRHPRASIVVYSPGRTDRVEEALSCASQARRNVPVIVVTDESNFSQYYSVMTNGAYDYYALTEDSERIARAVQRATRTQAA